MHGWGSVHYLACGHLHNTTAHRDMGLKHPPPPQYTFISTCPHFLYDLGGCVSETLAYVYYKCNSKWDTARFWSGKGLFSTKPFSLLSHGDCVPPLYKELAWSEWIWFLEQYWQIQNKPQFEHTREKECQTRSTQDLSDRFFTSGHCCAGKWTLWNGWNPRVTYTATSWA